jgi:integrase
MLDQLLGMVPQPPDQPSCATATATLAKCLVDYAETIANSRPFFLEWAGTAQCIHDSVSTHTQDIQGMVPSAPLTGRLAEFPALALLLTLRDEHLPLRVALGAEVARCLLEQTELKQDYCVALRRDTVRYGRPQPGEVRTPEDLAELGFGRGWLVRFQKTDARVRRRVELDELGPRRPPHAHPHHVLDLLARLRWRLDYPNAPVRIGELLVLRIGNVLDEGDHLVVEIARELRDGREKSREGRRRVTVRDITAMEIVRTWLARRAAELATHEDYLFGQSDRPTELAHSGRMYFWLNRLLKTVTGDESISLHAFRHSYASQRLAAMLLQENDDEVNPLDRLANEVGHIGGHVTAVHYCHIYEPGLRHAIDVALERLPLGYVGTSAWTGVAPETLRQRASRATRRGGSTAEILRTSLTDAALRIPLSAISDSIAMTVPASPLPPPQSLALTYAQVVGVLRETAAGLSTQQVGLRHAVPHQQVVRIVEAVGDFAERHGKRTASMLDALSHGMQALRESSGRLLGMRPDFARLSQRRWLQLTDVMGKIDLLRLQRATSYWERAVDDQHLAVRPGSEWESFMGLLADSGINRSLMSLHWSSTDQRQSEISDALARAQETVRFQLGASFAQVRHTHRHGRPPIWLVISSDGALRNRNGSANSITGLHCAFLAAWAWLRVADLEGSKYQ